MSYCTAEGNERGSVWQTMSDHQFEKCLKYWIDCSGQRTKQNISMYVEAATAEMTAAKVEMTNR